MLQWIFLSNIHGSDWEFIEENQPSAVEIAQGHDTCIRKHLIQIHNLQTSVDEHLQRRLSRKEHTFAKRLRRIHAKGNTHQLPILEKEVKSFVRDMKLIKKLDAFFENKFAQDLQGPLNGLQHFSRSLKAIWFEAATNYSDGKKPKFFLPKKAKVRKKDLSFASLNDIRAIMASLKDVLPPIIGALPPGSFTEKNQRDKVKLAFIDLCDAFLVYYCDLNEFSRFGTLDLLQLRRWNIEELYSIFDQLLMDPDAFTVSREIFFKTKHVDDAYGQEEHAAGYLGRTAQEEYQTKTKIPFAPSRDKTIANITARWKPLKQAIEHYGTAYNIDADPDMSWVDEYFNMLKEQHNMRLIFCDVTELDYALSQRTFLAVEEYYQNKQLTKPLDASNFAEMVHAEERMLLDIISAEKKGYMKFAGKKPQPGTLDHVLTENQFKCQPDTTNGHTQYSGRAAQHIWYRKDLPFTVRVKTNGEFSIGITDFDPQNPKSLCDMTQFPELMKIAKIDGHLYIIPAGTQGPWRNELNWLDVQNRPLALQKGEGHFDWK
ncbi:MAG: hypothetical protein H6850_01390 [Alphaproteobacteria bacterium]|nr:MAG: hypothetical protein H6850_01390 [Alphaproteobacteria bacterium]